MQTKPIRNAHFLGTKIRNLRKRNSLTMEDLSARCITPGTANTLVQPPCAGGSPVEIYAIQGSGLASPLDGQIVTTLDNVVTGVTDDGFFMQTPAARSDSL